MITESQFRILRAIVLNPGINRKDLAGRVGIPTEGATMAMGLGRLKALELITRGKVGIGTTTTWTVTDKGKAVAGLYAQIEELIA